MHLARRLSNVRPSPILGLVQKASQMRAEGLDVIDLGIGEPDFDTPDHVKEAAIAAITGLQGVLADRLAVYEKRRDLVVTGLAAIEGIDCAKPDGAFYLYPSLAGVLGKQTPDGVEIASDDDFCTYLLAQHLVSCVPGSAFGLSPHMRISTAASTEALLKAVVRIGQAVAALR